MAVFQSTCKFVTHAIMLKLTHTFSIEPYVKQGISKVYVIVEFICIGLLELQGAQSED